jgi:hypothetical protein
VVLAGSFNDKRGAAPETAYGSSEGNKALKGHNPMSGSGMKQGQQARGGSKRREVEKT